MAKAFELKKWHKIVMSILAFFVALILILGLVINMYWSPILSSEVKKVVAKSSDGLYKVSFSSAELHVLRGTIIIYDITLKPDTAVFNQKKRENLAPNNLVEMHVKRLTLSHIHPFKLYFQKKLDIGEIALNEPVLHVTYQLNHKKDTVLKQYKTPWQKISKSLHSIHIGSILLGDVKLDYEDYSGNKFTKSEFKEMNLSAYDLLIDSATQKDTSRRLFCKNIVVELNNYSGRSPTGLYTYTFDHLKLSTLTSRLNIEGLKLKPVNPEKFFSKSNKDKFTMRLDSLQLNNFDFLNYHKYRRITASSLILNNGSVEVFGIPNNAPPTVNGVETYPNVGLFKMNIDLQLDTVNVRQVNVFYYEHNSKSDKVGTVAFYNTSGSFLNITTRPAMLQKNNICTVDLNTMFMNQGKLHLAFTFNLTDNNHSFAYKGRLGPMNLKAINQATMPLTMLKINAGTLKQFDFDIHADRQTSRGKVLFLYNDVKVNILKPDTANDRLKSRPIETLYANIFILKHNNPDVAGGMPRSFYVTLPRKSETPFFKFAWQTLLEGIKPAIGLDKKKLNETVALVNQMTIDKQNRKIKKELRQQRRAARRARRAEKKLEKAQAEGE